LRIGTRGSLLALRQATCVRDLLAKEHPGIETDLVPIVTSGDRITNRPIAKIGGKAVFVKEVEQALHSGDIDLAVHSLKDVPAVLSDGLILYTILRRSEPRDALVLSGMDELPPGALVGTGSLRRKAQLLAWRPDLRIADIRGNVDTRLKKLDAKAFDALVLAAAGLIRLNLHQRVSMYLEPEICLPAAGQGAIGIEIRADDTRLQKLLAPLHDSDTGACTTAERAFNERLGGSCTLPAAAFATIDGDTLSLTGRVIHPQGTPLLERRIVGHRNAARTLGCRAAALVLGDGGDRIIRMCEPHSPLPQTS